MAELPLPWIGGATRTVGVIGWPVAHSLSPTIHNAAFAALGLDRVSVPLPVPPGSVGAALDGLVALGFDGVNVTMPHKAEVADRVDRRSEDAERLRAANTVVIRDDGLEGHNTDAPGFDRFLRRDARFEPGGRTALVFGAGGAARACALALARAGLDRLTVVLRETTRDAELRQALEGTGTQVVTVTFDDAASVRADLLVNATPLGMHGEELPEVDVGSTTVVVDLLYHPAITPFVRRARSAGAAAFGGLGLLLHQAALSLELWTGQPAPLEAMSAAATAALAERP
ncbi:MAG TPA: shikimate dehydrogenase [Actinomycetota bacterium]